MSKIDSNFDILFSHLSSKEIMAYEFRSRNLFANNEFPSNAGIPQMCCSLQGTVQSSKVFLLRSISMHGIRTTDLPGKFTGYRNCSTRRSAETLPHRYSFTSLSKHSAGCKRKPRLANLRRLCSCAHFRSARTLFKRYLRRSTRSHRLGSGLYDHRSLSIIIPLGKIPQTKSRSENAYAPGFARKHSQPCYYYFRQGSRCEHSRRTSFRGWSHLYYGSSLCRFQSPLPDSSSPGVFCDPSKKKFGLQAIIFSPCRQRNRSAMRPDYSTLRYTDKGKIPSVTPSYSILRYKNGQAFCFLNQQLFFFSIEHCKTLSMPMASGTVFQMDQATPENQNFLWYHRERCKDANLDCNNGLCPCCHHQETTPSGTKSLHNSTNIQRSYIRENPFNSGVFRNKKYGFRH